jgi:hypothetical protein
VFLDSEVKGVLVWAEMKTNHTVPAERNLKQKNDRQGYRPLLTKSSKRQYLFGIFCFLGISGLIMGWVMFSNWLKTPLLHSEQEMAYLSNTDPANAVSPELDVGRDNLGGYEGQTVRRASLSSADSASNRSSDKKEVMSGSGPNCAAGNKCSDPESSSANGIHNTESQAMRDWLTADELREFSRNTSAPRTDLKKMDATTQHDLHRDVPGQHAGTSVIDSVRTPSELPSNEPATNVPSPDRRTQGPTREKMQEFLLERMASERKTEGWGLAVRQLDDKMLGAVYSEIVKGADTDR